MTTTFTGALRLSAMTAPMVLDGPVNGDDQPADKDDFVAGVGAPVKAHRLGRLSNLIVDQIAANLRGPEGPAAMRFVSATAAEPGNIGVCTSFPAQQYPADRPVYVPTDHETVSAGEAFSHDLQQVQRATILGAITARGASPGGPVTAGQRFARIVWTGRAINPMTRTNRDGGSVSPDIAVGPSEALHPADLLGLRSIQQHAERSDDRDAAIAAMDWIEATSCGPEPAAGLAMRREPASRYFPIQLGAARPASPRLPR